MLLKWGWRHVMGEPLFAMSSHVKILGNLESTSSNRQLFRYMKLSTLLLLLEGKAYFPSISSLCNGDPFEGGLFCEPAWLITALRELQDAEGQLDEWLRKRANQWEGSCIDSPVTDPSFRSRLLSQIYIRELRDRRAAWCWFHNDLESAGMWSVYGHKGVAVRTSLSALRSSLPSNRSFQIAEMRYVDRRPCSEHAFDAEGKDRSLILRPHLLKAIEYRHENEIRVVAECPAKCGGILVEQVHWQALIEEIIISPLLPAQEAAAIKTILERYPWEKSVTIERSKLLPDNSTHTHDGLLEAIRQYKGGCHEPRLPAPIAEL
ncbi:MAG: DUF2971 domain-containing protein [Prosthecobacter sp.]|jgi:hypothetical protein